MGPYLLGQAAAAECSRSRLFCGSFFSLLLRGCILDPKETSFDLNS